MIVTCPAADSKCINAFPARRRCRPSDTTTGGENDRIGTILGGRSLQASRLDTKEHPLFVTTTFTIEGHEIVEYKGIVRGIIVRAPTIAQGILGNLKSIIGGQIGAYAGMCEQARQQAYDLLLEHAREVGANAIVGMRYDAAEVVGKDSATEVLCYGTAVVVRPIRRVS
jgi:uncharacterized protein YbjQ (UPF0145 family)